jgi:hypothetical protein
MSDFKYFTTYSIDPLLKAYPNLSADGLMPPGYRSAYDPRRTFLQSVRGHEEINLAALWLSMLGRGKTPGYEVTSDTLRLFAESAIGILRNGSVVAAALLLGIAVHDNGTLRPIVDVDLNHPSEEFNAVIRPAIVAAGEKKCVDEGGRIMTRRALLESRRGISQPNYPFKGVALANMFMSLGPSQAGGAL